MSRVQGPTSEAKRIKFTIEDISRLHSHLEEMEKLNLQDEATADKVRYRNLAPIIKLEQKDERTLFGQYQASYWGHSYENSKKGTIAADSINLRPFFFCVYLGEAGRIYIGSQYLGNYGGYTAIKETILKAFDKRGEITSTSFNFARENFKNATPKEVIVNYHKKGSKIINGSQLAQKGLLTFRMGKDDENLKDEVKEKLLDIDSPAKVKKALSKILKDSSLIEVDDDEIENCRVIVDVNGHQKTIYLIEGSNYATRFLLELGVNKEGHPEFEPMKKKSISVLQEIILPRVMND